MCYTASLEFGQNRRVWLWNFSEIWVITLYLLLHQYLILLCPKYNCDHVCTNLISASAENSSLNSKQVAAFAWVIMSNLLSCRWKVQFLIFINHTTILLAEKNYLLLFVCSRGRNWCDEASTVNQMIKYNQHSYIV